jgi:hypothetical protein
VAGVFSLDKNERAPLMRRPVGFGGYFEGGDFKAAVPGRINQPLTL